MNATNTIRILLAEDHAVVRDGLAAIINSEADLTVIAEAEDGQQAVELYPLHQPDVMLLDLRMPRLEGVEAIIRIRANFPNARIIVLTTFDGDEDIYRGLHAGAQGYLLKGCSTEELLDAIRTVHEGKKYVPQNVALKLSDRVNRLSLTDRELMVLQLLVKGRSNQALAQELEISEGTVKFHVNNILHKLGVNDRTQAVIIALKRGLARLDD
jgi:two-component system, NarL family, response regulator